MSSVILSVIQFLFFLKGHMAMWDGNRHGIRVKLRIAPCQEQDIKNTEIGKTPRRE
jgi:hypothetical protein